MGAVGKSVVGMRRNNNEDAIYVSEAGSPTEGIYIVADGMGGCNAGEIASSNAVEAFLEYMTADLQSADLQSADLQSANLQSADLQSADLQSADLQSADLQSANLQSADLQSEPLDMLVGGIAACNTRVYKKSLESAEYAEMGTTIVATIVQNNRLYVAHVGDSRAYIFQNGSLKQLTSDHSYVMELVRLGNISMEQAAVHPKRHIITRAIGTKDTVEVDTVICDFNKGDIALLCSDGLSNMISNEAMEEILALEETISNKLDRLVNLANQNGGDDNISLVLIEE